MHGSGGYAPRTVIVNVGERVPIPTDAKLQGDKCIEGGGRRGGGGRQLVVIEPTCHANTPASPPPGPRNSAEHVNRAPVAAGPSPTHSYAAFRNTPIALPILGAAPAAPSLAAPGGALFRDPDGDALLVRIVAPPQDGTVAVDPATGAVVFRPPYMAKKVPDGKVVQFQVQAADRL